MRNFFLLIILLSGTAQAGDWTGSFLETLGDFYPGLHRIDDSENRFENAACDQFGAFLAGKYGIGNILDVRVFAFVGLINDAQFWKNTGKFKREVVDFGFGKERVTLIKAETRPYPYQQLAAPKNFKNTKFFVGLGGTPIKRVLCTATFYE